MATPTYYFSPLVTTAKAAELLRAGRIEAPDLACAPRRLICGLSR